jgi:hypothetical protein
LAKLQISSTRILNLESGSLAQILPEEDLHSSSETCKTGKIGKSGKKMVNIN